MSQALAAAKRAQGLTQLAAPGLDALLGMRGVVEVVEGEESEEAHAKLEEALLKGLGVALGQLVAARMAEGARLATVMANQLSQIASLVERAANASARSAGRHHAAPERADRADSWRVSAGLDPERLHQEALLLAAKADIQEELDRLRSHVTAAQDLLAQDQPVGRRLEFLAQEFNREANTICSKASDIEISRAGLELKTVIDQLREQVQNIE